MTILRSGSATDVGRIRRINQDLALETANLFAIADGMGGHAGGEVAAQVAVDSLRTAFARQPSTEGLEQAVIEANRAVWRRSQSQADLRGMGTTLTAAALVAGADGRDVVALANVGDSRAYLFSGGAITQVTSDHSLAEEQVRLGELSEEQAAVDPRRHILTRVLGVAADVNVDLWELRPLSGDRILLCSDGLTNEVGNDTLVEVLGSVTDPTEAAQELVDAAMSNGGSDNITVVVIDVLLGEDGSSAAESLAVGAAAEAGTPDGPSPAQGAGSPVVPTDDLSARSAVDDASDSDSDRDCDSSEAGTAGTSAGRADMQEPSPDGAGSTSPATSLSTAPGSVATLEGDDAVSLLQPGRPGQPGQPAEPGGTAEAEAPAKVRKETRRERRRRLGVPRRVTVRVVLFFLLVAGVFVAAYYGIRYYANDNWYVTLKGDQLVIYRGQPGGVLWFKPRLVDRTGVSSQQVLPIRVSALQADVSEPSLRAARGYVANLQQEYQDQQTLQHPPPSSPAVPVTTVPAGGAGTGPPTTASNHAKQPAISTTTTVTDTPGPPGTGGN